LHPHLSRLDPRESIVREDSAPTTAMTNRLLVRVVFMVVLPYFAGGV
jgi:hypothetical protein